MTDRVSKILSEVKSRGPDMWDNSRLTSVVGDIRPPLSETERLQLVIGLIKKDTFLWLDYVSEEIQNLASTDPAYIDFLSDMINRVKKDLAGGQIIRALIQVGQKNSRLGIELSSTMRQRNEESLMQYSSFPLGGAARTDFERVNPIIDELWTSDYSQHKVAALRALRITFEPGRANRPVTERVFQLFERASASEDIEVKKEGVQGLFDLAEVDQPRSVKTLISLVKEPTPIRSLVAGRLLTQKHVSRENEVALLKLIAQDDNDGILSQVAMLLMMHGKNFPQEAMQIVISLTERGKYRDAYELDYAAEQVASVNLAGAIKAVENAFANTTSEHFKFYAPHLLTDISKSNYLVLSDFIKLWLRDRRFEKMAVQTAKEMLQEIFGGGDSTVGDILYPTLESLALERDIDVQTIIKGENDKTAQCIDLLNAIERGRPRLNYDEIQRNWQKYPSLKAFLGDRWVRQRQQEDNRTHEILYNLAYLSREQELEDLLKRNTKELDPFQSWVRSMHVRELLWPGARLEHLNEMVEVLQTKGVRDNVGGLKDRLTRESEYPAAFSELQVISSFAAKGYPIAIEPSLGAKALDLEVVIENSRILFEVKNPEMLRKLKYASGGMVPNRARTIIHAEFTQHLAELPNIETRPIVIILDIGRSEIDYDFVVDYLYGTLQFTFLRDTQTGKIINKGWTRAEDSIHRQAGKTSENLDLISAVICYKTKLGDDLKFRLQGTMFLNPTAQNRLSEIQADKISRALFGVSLQETIPKERSDS